MNAPESTTSRASWPILVVDDEEVVLAALREMLRREGYEVVGYTDAAEALAALGRRPFAVIVSDYQMPVLTGVEFLAQAKRLQPQAARVLVTAAMSVERMTEAINESEVCRILIKPWTRDQLLEAIGRAVQVHAQWVAASGGALAAGAGSLVSGDEVGGEGVGLQAKFSELLAWAAGRPGGMHLLAAELQALQQRLQQRRP
jgi:DNA-binding NtrC family response regulator